MTTVGEPIVVRALPEYEPNPGRPRASRLSRSRLRLVPEQAPTPPAAPEVPAAVCDRIRHLLGQVLEAIDGRRPVDQLKPHFTPRAFATVQTWSRGRTTSRSRLHRLHTRQPADGVLEACATVEIDARIKAVAIRFELRNRLRCSVFRML